MEETPRACQDCQAAAHPDSLVAASGIPVLPAVLASLSAMYTQDPVVPKAALAPQESQDLVL